MKQKPKLRGILNTDKAIDVKMEKSAEKVRV